MAASVHDQCLATVPIVANSMLDDAHWKAFGYKHRPRRGSWFNRSIGASKLERETVLLQELFAASFGVIFCWALDARHFDHRVAFIAKLMEYCIDGLGKPLWPAVRFASRHDAVQFLHRACRDYAGVDQNEHSQVFLERCMAAMKQQVPAAWLSGAAFLFVHPNSLVCVSNTAMTKSGVAENSNCGIEVDDAAFLSVAEDLFEDLALE